MTIDELKQSLIDIYNEAIKQQHECVKHIIKADIYVNADRPGVVNVDLWPAANDKFLECYAFALKDGKPYCIDDGMPADFSSVDAFFMTNASVVDDDKGDEVVDPNSAALEFFRQHFYVQTDDQVEPDYVAHHWLVCKDAPYVSSVVVISQQEFETLSKAIESRHGKLHALNGKVTHD